MANTEIKVTVVPSNVERASITILNPASTVASSGASGGTLVEKNTTVQFKNPA